MRTFVKYFLIGLGLQVLLVVAFFTIGPMRGSMLAHMLDDVVYIYDPFMSLVAMTMRPGEAQMISSGLVGIPLGVIFYSAALGLLAVLLKRGQAR